MMFQVAMFMRGLQDVISNAVRLHHPESVDEAASLALLQEEVLGEAKERTQRVDYEE